MKLLIVPDKGRSYTSTRPEAEIYISLAKRGHDITLCADESSAYLEKYKQANIDVHILNYGKKLSWHSIKTINRLIKQKSIDLVYATTSRTIPNAAMACIGTSAKMVAYRGTTGGLYKSDLSNYLTILSPRVNGVVCVSNAVTDYVKDKVRASIKSKVRTIYKGHDVNWYSPSGAELEQFNTDQSKFNVVCVGSHRPYKGMHIFLEALSHLTDLSNLRVILVGDKFEGEPFQQQIQATKMAERICQPGFRQDVPEIARACDLLVLPSIREGLPRVVMESLANNTPVLSSANPGAMEIITDNENGYIVPLNNAIEMADKIRFLYDNPAELERLTNNASKVIQAELSHERTVDAMEAYFSELIAQ
ncbi:glycosyltransferase family 4 protein [Thalassotalea sp. LPB0316]|uniref:glycosyltransferase family 4 protein n=1 Tax=Thalassotalea sp. LPB0316 TaxID=2769490 RepID=UPI0018664EF4|nr:glycosyltransferase family 4 protein [Thalassotalea sp. LPB0316]QOL26918.1 glycosyltransferase family 4 protein [Thalassotalea sp. LPB0316]